MKIIYDKADDSKASCRYPRLFILANILSRKIAIIPKNTIFAIIEPIKAEYLARGPKFSTACDSNFPGVTENNVWDVISGRNSPPLLSFSIIATATAAAPAARPATKGTRSLHELFATYFDRILTI